MGKNTSKTNISQKMNKNIIWHLITFQINFQQQLFFPEHNSQHSQWLLWEGQQFQVPEKPTLKVILLTLEGSNEIQPKHRSKIYHRASLQTYNQIGMIFSFISSRFRRINIMTTGALVINCPYSFAAWKFNLPHKNKRNREVRDRRD